jgi:GntR family transcriptional regulator
MHPVRARPVAEPLHEQVHAILRDRIVGGDWKPHVLLPGEVQLAQELGVSVGTVRKAMDQLARDGLVFRERGRGTFVRGDQEWQSAAGFKLLDRAGKLMVPSIEVIEAEVSRASADEIRDLELAHGASGAPRVLRLSRVWRCGTTIVNREVCAVEPGDAPEVVVLVDTDGAQGAQSVYEAAIRKRIDRTIWLISGHSHGEAQQLSPEASGHELCMRRLAVDARGRPVELSRHRITLAACMVQFSR